MSSSNLALVALILFFLLLWLGKYSLDRNGNWHRHDSFKRGREMRRRGPDGRWQYRSMSDAERADDDALNA